VNYNEYTSNDFVYAKGGNYVNLINKDIEDWTITFADTGINATLGERLLAVEQYLEGEEYFLANYSDALTDLPLDKMVEDFHVQGKAGMFMVTQPTRSFHVVKLNEGNKEVKEITTLANSGLWVNAGYFIFNKSIFNYLQPGEDLVEDALPQLLRRNELSAYTFNGTWIPMDTFKEKQMLDDMYSKGDTPWEVWKKKRNVSRISA
jgi:glucose-1-phosphate cytidylyltransferase